MSGNRCDNMYRSIGTTKAGLVWHATRCLSQRVEIKSLNSSSPIAFNVNIMKAPSNFGYASSRVNRPYNEDRYQAGILDMDLNIKKVGDETSNSVDAYLNERINKLTEPAYTNNYLHQKVFNYSVFDGHGGGECSEYLKSHLLESVERLQITEETIDFLMQFYRKKIGGYWKRWYRRENQQLLNAMGLGRVLKENESKELLLKSRKLHDSKTKLWQLPEFASQVTPYDFFKLRVFLSFLYVDYQFLTYENMFNHTEEHKVQHIQGYQNSMTGQEQVKIINSGSTCTSAFIYCVDKDNNDPDGYYFHDNVLSRLLVAQVGDTRAILCDKNGVAHALTRDHHPSNPTESRRLTKFSANLIMTDSFGEERYLNLANTRSFGDISAKDVGVSAEPEFFDYLIGDPAKMEKYIQTHGDHLKKVGVKWFGGDECFLALVSDGVTNCMTDQEVVDVITSTTDARGTPKEAATQVDHFVEDVGGDDNATCCIVRLNGWGKWPKIDRTKELREDRLGNVLRRT